MMQTTWEHLSVDQFYPRWLLAGEHGEACTVIDVRSPEEYARGHVPAAQLLPLPVLPQAAQRIERERPVYLICQGGVRSRQAMEYLRREHGLTNLINIDGGTMAWIHSGYPIERSSTV